MDHVNLVDEDLIIWDDDPPTSTLIEVIEDSIILEIQRALKKSRHYRGYRKNFTSDLIYKYSVHIDSSCCPTVFIARSFHEFELSRIPCLKLNMRFLRPILIDAFGVSRAYNSREYVYDKYGSPTPENHNFEQKIKQSDFTMVPLIRCLFFWISRGYKTVLCFPDLTEMEENPILGTIHGFSIDYVDILLALTKAELIEYYSVGITNRFEWFIGETNRRQAALVSDISEWNKLAGNGYNCDMDQIRVVRPGVFLQPYFNDDLVYFPPGFKKATSPWDRINITEDLEVAHLSEPEEFDSFVDEQLLYLDQLKQMKLILNHLPNDQCFYEFKAFISIMKSLMETDVYCKFERTKHLSNELESNNNSLI